MRIRDNLKYAGRILMTGRLAACILAIGLMATILACTHPVRRLVFQSHEIETAPPFPGHVSGLERFWLDSDQGAVEGWLLKGESTDIGQLKPAVIIAHGNRELIDHYLDRAMGYRNMGYTVLLGEYRGYGRSAGKPSRKRIRTDYIRFFDKLASCPGVNPEQIIFHGRSLGGAVLADLLSYRRPAAVILESTFTSIKAMAHNAPDFLLSDNYDTLSAMKVFDGPVLIIHGTRDQVVPFAHAQRLHRALPRATFYSGDFGHSERLWERDSYWHTIRGFFKSNLIMEKYPVKTGQDPLESAISNYFYGIFLSFRTTELTH